MRSCVKPCGLCFETGGTIEALRRLWGLAVAQAGSAQPPCLPEWVFFASITQILGSEAEMDPSRRAAWTTDLQAEAAALVPSMAQLERDLAQQLEEQLGSDAIAVPDALLGVTSVSGGAGTSASGTAQAAARCAVTAVRLLVGACCELAAALAAATEPHCSPRTSLDSLHAASWTSAHANFAADLETEGISASLPTLHSVPSELTDADPGDLFARRLCPRSVECKEAVVLLNVMARCTSPGTRGFEATLRVALS